MSIILQYILKQLASSNTTDLLLFRDTIKHMANIEVVSPADLSENGIAALSGGKTLRSEFSTPTTVQKLRASRKAAQKPLLRLHSALVGFQYAGALLIRVAKAREDCVYLAEEEDAQQLRFLGNMYDQVRRLAAPVLSGVLLNRCAGYLHPHSIARLFHPHGLTARLCKRRSFA